MLLVGLLSTWRAWPARVPLGLAVVLLGGWLALAASATEETLEPSIRPPVTPTPYALPEGWTPGSVVTEGTGCVALTFDMGGTDAGATAEVLQTLAESKLTATFFLTGQWAEANPELVRQMVTQGHELANHSYDHPRFTYLSEAEMLSQLEDTEAAVRRAAGVELRPFFRPPFGAYNYRTQAVLAERGYLLVYWSLDSTDWREDSTAASVAHRVSALADAGDVVVFHGYSPKTAAALPTILQQLTDRGLCLVPLGQALGSH